MIKNARTYTNLGPRLLQELAQSCLQIHRQPASHLRLSTAEESASASPRCDALAAVKETHTPVNTKVNKLRIKTTRTNLHEVTLLPAASAEVLAAAVNQMHTYVNIKEGRQTAHDPN